MKNHNILRFIELGQPQNIVTADATLTLTHSMGVAPADPVVWLRCKTQDPAFGDLP